MAKKTLPGSNMPMSPLSPVVQKKTRKAIQPARKAVKKGK